MTDFGVFFYSHPMVVFSGTEKMHLFSTPKPLLEREAYRELAENLQ